MGKKRKKLIESLRPVPTIHTAREEVPSSILSIPTVPRPPPTVRNVAPDEKPAFDDYDKIASFQSLSEENCPPGFSFK